MRPFSEVLTVQAFSAYAFYSHAPVPPIFGASWFLAVEDVRKDGTSVESPTGARSDASRGPRKSTDRSPGTLPHADRTRFLVTLLASENCLSSVGSRQKHVLGSLVPPTSGARFLSWCRAPTVVLTAMTRRRARGGEVRGPIWRLHGNGVAGRRRWSWSPAR